MSVLKKKYHQQQQQQLQPVQVQAAGWAARSSFHYFTALLVAVSLAVVTVYWIGEIRHGLWAANQVKSRPCEDDKPGNSSSSSSSPPPPPSLCDLFKGKWVFDNKSYPLYKEKQCSIMSNQVGFCEKYGRKDFGYQTWRWQPDHCNLPRFNATALLEKLRGKRLVFVGDSLNRGQWTSMVCLVDSTIPSHLNSIVYNGSLVSYRAIEYNASIEFYWAPFLVESNSDDPFIHRWPERIVRVESIEKHARHWTDADIIVFNSYLWWLVPARKMKLLWGSFESPDDGIYKDVEMTRSYEMALTTWAHWLEFHVNRSKSQLFFVSLSPTHERADEWGGSAAQNCYKETKPILKDDYWGINSVPAMMKVAEQTIEGLKLRGVQVQLLNITQLSEYRKEGHLSIYRKLWQPLTKEQLSNPASYADCSHWCLPGVPDVWNELLYAHLFPYGNKSD